MVKRLLFLRIKGEISFSSKVNSIKNGGFFFHLKLFILLNFVEKFFFMSLQLERTITVDVMFIKSNRYESNSDL